VKSEEKLTVMKNWLKIAVAGMRQIVKKNVNSWLWQELRDNKMIKIKVVSLQNQLKKQMRFPNYKSQKLLLLNLENVFKKKISNSARKRVLRW
jgi:hypothetical protein